MLAGFFFYLILELLEVGEHFTLFLHQCELLIFYSLPDTVVPKLDMLRPGLVRRVLGKVDGTLTVAIELLSDTKLTDEFLHP